MPVNDTNTVTPAFIEDQPDWALQVQTIATWRTTVATATNGAEQRARWRMRPRYAIVYTLSALNMAELTVRRSKYITELQSPVVVPIWTDFYPLVSMPASTTLNLGISLANKKFKVGSYVYISGNGSPANCFRKITAVNSTTLSILTAPTFSAGALIYPCILGQHKSGDGGFDLRHLNRTDETISIEEL